MESLGHEIRLRFDEPRQESPEFVRLSFASALALRLRSGQFHRSFAFGGINLLLNYGDGCRSDCAYCGLARSRPGQYEEKSFIRVEWPLVPTDEVVDRLARYEPRLTRLCISMVTHPRAYRDTLDISRRIRQAVQVPLSILVAPPTLNRERLESLRDAGVDMIGVGLDAVTEPLFRQHRTQVPSGGGLRWSNYMEVIRSARDVFGPWKVNCHVLVGIGETDRELVDAFFELTRQEILPYLFCFNPEPDSRLGTRPKSTVRRWRRIQLVKYLIDRGELKADELVYDAEGSLNGFRGSRTGLDRAVNSGVPFLTNGCPARDGSLGCSRPYGSYRPSEPTRDYPYLPAPEEMVTIRQELALDELCDAREPSRAPGPAPCLARTR
jgi:lipoyl synthase